MPKWSDFGNIWSTLRELDVNTIREEAERPFMLACVGHDRALDEIDRLLHSGFQRYPVAGANPLELIPLAQAAQRAASVNNAAMLLIAVDTRNTLSQAEAAAFARLSEQTIPFLVVLIYGDRLPTSEVTLPAAISARAVVLADPSALNAADQLAMALLGRLPGELHLAAARRLSGLRAAYARELIASTSFTNATYALASGLPEQIPIISVPFAAADILILTKNQAMMVYRLALAYGAPPDFQARIREVLPVIGGAFLWRQAARSLIGLIPIWGLLPKVAIAYGGSYTTGVAAWRWYESGELVSTEQLKRISQEAMAIGRTRAAELISRARGARAQASASGSGLIGRLKALLPHRDKSRQLGPPNE